MKKLSQDRGRLQYGPSPEAFELLAKAEQIAAETLIIEHEDLPDEILAAAAPVIKKIKVAAESGAVDHIAHPTSLPGTIRLLNDGTLENFGSASGDSIKNHGKAAVKLRTKEGNVVGNVFEVADVCRPLHSVSRICDTGHEMLFTENEGIVVPKGTFASMLAQVSNVVARYPREAGFYVAEMEVKSEDDSEQSFPRPGPGR